MVKDTNKYYSLPDYTAQCTLTNIYIYTTVTAAGNPKFGSYHRYYDIYTVATDITEILYCCHCYDYMHMENVYIYILWHRERDLQSICVISHNLELVFVCECVCVCVFSKQKAQTLKLT